MIQCATKQRAEIWLAEFVNQRTALNIGDWNWAFVDFAQLGDGSSEWSTLKGQVHVDCMYTPATSLLISEIFSMFCDVQ